jgi:acylphosphatase
MITGRVAGVGFRTFVQRQTAEFGIQGSAENLPDGRIKVVATGPQGTLDKLEALLRRGPPAAKVDEVVTRVLPSVPEPPTRETDVHTPQPANAPPRSEWPSWELLLDERGRTVDRGADAIASGIQESGITDLFILVHGWKVDRANARSMFQRFTASTAAVAQMSWIRSARVGALGVIWPSIAWPDDDEGASAASAEPPMQLENPEHQKALEEATSIVNSNPDDAAALERLNGLVRNLGEGAATPSSGVGSPKGLAGFIGSLWQGAKGALRSTSYFQMQNRAVVVGREGLGPFLGRLSEQFPQLRVHLVAHSIGARLAGHALASLADSGRRGTINSLALLQGVLSHHAFAPSSGPGNSRPGALAGAIRQVNGPVIVTYSHNDKAASLYETATRVSRDEAAPGEERTAIGALGHDGARNSNAINVVLGPVGRAYEFKPGLIFNVDASAAIVSHGDVFRPEVAWLLIAAAGAGSHP